MKSPARSAKVKAEAMSDMDRLIWYAKELLLHHHIPDGRYGSFGTAILNLKEFIEKIEANPSPTPSQKREEALAKLHPIFAEVAEERKRQDEKWGEQNWPSVDEVLVATKRGPSRLCEEYEIPTETRAKAMLKLAFMRKAGTYAHIAVEEMCEAVAARNDAERREELVQLAAVCVAWIECIDRREEKRAK